jgi:hypothetical protein
LYCKMEEIILRGFVGSYIGNMDRGSGRVAKALLHGQFVLGIRAMQLSEHQFEEGRGASISLFHVNLIGFAFDAASWKSASLAMHAARASEL